MEVNPAATLRSTLRQPCGAVAELIARAVSDGLSVWVDGEAVRVKGPAAAKQLGEEIIRRKPEVKEFLAGWDQRFAILLTHQTDGVVAASGASGLDAEIRYAAAECVRCFEERDTPGVVNWCRRIQTRARYLAALGGSV